jgi:hypothetical protein
MKIDYGVKAIGSLLSFVKIPSAFWLVWRLRSDVLCDKGTVKTHSAKASFRLKKQPSFVRPLATPTPILTNIGSC